jgi:hypothetical protein
MKPLVPALLAALCLLPFSTSAGEPQASEDNPQVYIWGINQGCTSSPQRTEAVRRYLHSIAYPVKVLDVPPELQGCQGEECVRIFNQRCPGNRKGVLLGGRVEEINKVVRVRL